MRKKIKTIISCLLFLSLTFFVLYRTSGLLEKKYSVQKYAPFFKSDTDFDVIFMGTSHMQNGILPQELWREYGITSYNFGNSNCTLAEDYWLIQEVLKYSSPKLFVIDLFGIIEYEQFGNGKYRDDSIEQQRVQFDAFPLSPVKAMAVNDVFDDYENRLDFLFKFLVYHDRWDDLTKEDFQPELTTEKGAQLLDGVSEGADYAPVTDFEPVEIASVCAGYVDRIIDLCKKKNVDVLFIYAPSPTYEGGVNCSKTLETYMQQYDVPYLNLLYIDTINGVTDFYTDNGHLNYSGQKKFTSCMGSYLQQTCQMQDHRGEEGYASWDADYEKYIDHKKKVLSDQKDINAKLMLAYGQDFHVDIQVDPESEAYDNWTLQMFIWNLGDNASLNFVEDLSIDGEKCQMVLSFIDNRTGEAFEVKKVA